MTTEKTVRKSKKSIVYRNLSLQVILPVLTFGALFMPLAAEAGFVSFISGLFKEANASETATEAQNSQTISLLQAPKEIPAVRAQASIKEVTIEGDALVADSAPVGESSVTVKPASSQISTYVVKPGDSVSQIAKMFNVSSNTILLFNDIPKGATLTPGKVIRILPISSVSYTVAKGDTVAKVAKKYGADEIEIIQYNDLADGSLKAGTTLLIPDPEGEIANQIVKAAGAATKTTTAPRKVVNNLPNIAGYYARPTSGSCTQGIHGHNGVDIGGRYGTAITAAAAGTVVIARPSGYNGGYGLMVAVSHPNGTETLYGHMSQVSVTEGQSVAQGQTIGAMGNSGLVHGPTGVHLHFEVRGARNPFCN